RVRRDAADVSGAGQARREPGARSRRGDPRDRTQAVMSRSAAGLRAVAALALVTILGAGAAELPTRVGGLTALPPANVGGRNVITNGGFDEGSGTPSGWSLGPAGAWALDPAGRTGPSLRLADADNGQVVANAEQTVT